jgi:hypothetical protein
LYVIHTKVISYSWQRCLFIFSGLQLMSVFILFWNLKNWVTLKVVFWNTSLLSHLDTLEISVSSGRIILGCSWSAYATWLGEYHPISLKTLAWRYWWDRKTSHGCRLWQLRFIQVCLIIFCLRRWLLSVRTIFRRILLKITYKMLFFKKFINYSIWWHEWLGIYELAGLVYCIWEASVLGYLWVVIQAL